MSNENSMDRGWNFPIETQHTVPGVRVIGEDLSLMRRMVWESMVSVGITVKYFKCSSNVPDFYQDPKCTWDSGVSLDAMFEDNPKVKLLKDLGWYTEDDERPQLVYLPMYKDWVNKEILEVKDNSLIQVFFFGQVQPAEFRITEKKLDSVYGCYYICKLAPERMDNFVVVQDEGSYYLKRADREFVECAHDIAHEEAVSEAGGVEPDNREYFHENYNDYSSLIMGS